MSKLKLSSEQVESRGRAFARLAALYSWHITAERLSNANMCALSMAGQVADLSHQQKVEVLTAAILTLSIFCIGDRERDELEKLAKVSHVRVTSHGNGVGNVGGGQ